MGSFTYYNKTYTPQQLILNLYRGNSITPQIWAVSRPGDVSVMSHAPYEQSCIQLSLYNPMLEISLQVGTIELILMHMMSGCTYLVSRTRRRALHDQFIQ